MELRYWMFTPMDYYASQLFSPIKWPTYRRKILRQRGFDMTREIEITPVVAGQIASQEI